MGLILTIKGANFVNNVNEDVDFSYKSNGVDVYTYTNGILAFKPTTPTNYEFLAANFLAASVRAVPPIVSGLVNNVVVGLLSNGDAAVLYLNATGTIRQFTSAGSSGDSLYTIPTDRPNVPAGTTYQITHLTTGFKIDYEGYSKTVDYSLIPGFSIPLIGGLATGSSLSQYEITI